MSALQFLSLARPEASDRFRPLARSSLERRLRDAGARFEERDGWLVAVEVPGEERYALVIRDVTHAYVVREGTEGVEIHLRGGVPGDPNVAARYRYGNGAEGALDEARLVDVSAGYAALEIEGPGATTVLRRLTELDLEALPAVGAVAHVRTWIFPYGEDAYRLFFAQEFGHYLWEVVVDAAEPLGGGPKGTP